MKTLDEATAELRILVNSTDTPRAMGMSNDSIAGILGGYSDAIISIYGVDEDWLLATVGVVPKAPEPV